MSQSPILQRCSLFIACVLLPFLLKANPIINTASCEGEKVPLFEYRGSIIEIPGFRNSLESGILLAINKAALTDILEYSESEFQLTIPASREVSLVLNLKSKSPFDKGMEVKTSSGATLLPGKIRHFTGTVKEYPLSIFSVTISEEGIMGLINLGNGQTLILGPTRREGSEEHILYDLARRIDNPDVACEADFLPLSEKEAAWLSTYKEGMNSGRSEDNCVRVYLECEYDYFTERGSVASVVSHVSGLFNMVSTLYSEEDITITISEIFVWNTPDNFPTTNGSAVLSAFKALRPTFNGDLAHLVSRGAPTGGTAYVDGLCNSNAYGYSHIYPGYSEVPDYSWSVQCITHEIGHNLGSRHTHDCVWNGNETPIDRCGQEAGYGAECGGQLPGSGTIMSYCHLLQNVGIDFANGLGQQPGDLIRWKVSGASCLSSCIEPLVLQLSSLQNITCYGAGDGAIEIQCSGGQAELSYSWSNGGTGTIQSQLSEGNYTVTVSDGNQQTSETYQIDEPNKLRSSSRVWPTITPGVEIGKIKINPKGGVSPYTYLWDNGSESKIRKSLAEGVYSFTLTDANGCSYQENNAIDIDCPKLVRQFPFIEGFDGGKKWFQNVDDDKNWRYRQGPTPTPNTGPPAAASGQKYMYMEANQMAPGDLVKLTSPCFDFSDVISPYFEFKYHMMGVHSGSLVVQASTNNYVFETLWQITGEQGESWQTQNIDLSEFIGETLILRMVAIRAGGSKGDIAIDGLKVGDGCSVNVPQAIVINVSCHGLADGEITLNPSSGQGSLTYLWSSGENTAAIADKVAGSYTVTVTSPEGCSATGSFQILSPAIISLAGSVEDEAFPGAENGSISVSASGGTAPYIYNWSNYAQTSTISGLGEGQYALSLTDANGCLKTATYSVEVIQLCNGGAPLPNVLNFEGSIAPWLQEQTDDFDWSVGIGLTPSLFTGPYSAYQGSKYLYTEGGSNEGETASLRSPCYDLSGISNGSVFFAYNMYGSQMGSLKLQITTDEGQSWTMLWEKSGNQGSSWHTQTVSLASYQDMAIQLRFSGTPGGNLSDMAIDDIRVESGVSDLPPPIDFITRDSSLEAVYDILVYPNPARDVLRIKITEAFGPAVQYRISDAQGRVAAKGQIASHDIGTDNTIQLNNISPGLYFLELGSGENVHVEKVMITK